MTIEQFVAKFGRKLKRERKKAEIKGLALIRVGEKCPIEYVAGTNVGEHNVGSHKLGLTGRQMTAIMNAADDIFGPAKLRTKLLAAAGLKEAW